MFTSGGFLLLLVLMFVEDLSDGPLWIFAHTICSSPGIAEKELQHLEEVLGACKYPKWTTEEKYKKYIAQELGLQNSTGSQKFTSKIHH